MEKYEKGTYNLSSLLLISCSNNNANTSNMSEKDMQRERLVRLAIEKKKKKKRQKKEELRQKALS